MKFLFFFVDGVGAGSENPQINPIARFGGPLLRQTIPSLRRIENSPLMVKDLDAHMGIPGAPQSATGQTALWTGLKGPRIVKRHVTGIPGPDLIQVIQEHSILKRFNEAGLKADLINAFSQKYLTRIRDKPRHLSVSTRLQLASGRPFRNIQDLKKNNAISMDIDGAYLARHYPELMAGLPRRNAKEEGRHFCQIGRTMDLIIFEFFLTDLAGHDYEMDEAERICNLLEYFLEGVLEEIDPDHELLIVSSDHGNFEDLTTSSHTENRVPMMLHGKESQRFLDDCHYLSDIPRTIYRLAGIDFKVPEHIED